MKLLLLIASLVSLLSVTSAFVNPSSRSVTPAVAAAVKVPTATSLFVSTPSNDDDNNSLTLAATTVSVMTFLGGAAAPLAAFAEEAGDYEYGAVAAPGGIGLAVGLGVLAVSVLSVPPPSLFFHGGDYFL